MKQQVITKDKRLQVRFEEVELQRIKDIARKEKRTVSQIIRIALKKTFNI